jgi:hypothetical protein
MMGTFISMIFGTVYVCLSTVYYGWALSTGWNWVMPKALDLPRLGIAVSIAIISVVAMATGLGPRALTDSVFRPEPTGKQALKLVGWHLFYPIMFLLEMSIIRKYM